MSLFAAPLTWTPETVDFRYACEQLRRVEAEQEDAVNLGFSLSPFPTPVSAAKTGSKLDHSFAWFQTMRERDFDSHVPESHFANRMSSFVGDAGGAVDQVNDFEFFNNFEGDEEEDHGGGDAASVPDIFAADDEVDQDEEGDFN